LMRLMLILLICSSLLACGSQQPDGQLDSCSGDIRLSEKIYTVLWSDTLYVNQGTSVGQYFRFRTGLVIKEVMIEIVTLTGNLKVSIYKNRVSDTFTTETLPIKEYTITSGLTPNENHELWITLPESFEVPVTSDEDRSAGNFYFIALEPVGGNLVLLINDRDPLSRLREGIRSGSGGAYGATEIGRALDMGFRGEANCQSASN